MDTLRNKKRIPTHPGALLREVVLPELEITQGEFADRLGVSRRIVSELLHERRPITPDMAIRLGKLLGCGCVCNRRWMCGRWSSMATINISSSLKLHRK